MAGGGERKTYRAKWLLTDPWTVHENGYVQTAGNVVESVGTGRPPSDAPVIDLGPGVMMPPLVNAHTHLELSALEGRLPFDLGFRQWTNELIQKRETFSEQDLISHAKKALADAMASGVGALGEISTLGITCDLLATAPVGGVFFHEHLGASLPEAPRLEKGEILSRSLSAHAPHTTAPALLKEIARATSRSKLVMSLHLSESGDEMQFIQSARGAWADFLAARGIDFSTWPLGAESPVCYLRDLGILSGNLMAVHLLHVSGEDMQILKDHHVSICVCPRSNQLLHGRLPDIPGFLSMGFRPCLGTDSLASCPSLSILDEMAFVAEHFSAIPPADIIAMGTVHGAEALGIEKRFGRLAPGFQAPPLYIPVDIDSSGSVAQAIVSAGTPLMTTPPISAEKK